MDFVFVTGKLGQGKTLVSVSKIKQRIERGCLVATNCDIFLDKMFHKKTDKPRLIRIPDKPSLADLNMIGRGRSKSCGYDESKNGLLVLDECGTWFNSRNWQDKSRQEVNNWFLHARKLGWDVYLVVQDISIVDSQARSALTASIARCKRMDKVAIPFLTTFSKWFLGFEIRPHKFHMARVEDSDGLFLDRWVYRGAHLYKAYDTEQVFRPDYPHGVYSFLTPWHVYGRHMVDMNRENIMRITKIYWRRFSRPVIAVLSSVLASVCSVVATYAYLEPAGNVDLAAVSEPVVEPEKPKLLAERFEGWQYSGSMNINNRPTYFFRNDKGVKVTSDSGVMAGVAFRDRAHCLIELVKGSDTFLLECSRQDV